MLTTNIKIGPDKFIYKKYLKKKSKS